MNGSIFFVKNMRDEDCLKRTAFSVCMEMDDGRESYLHRGSSNDVLSASDVCSVE